MYDRLKTCYSAFCHQGIFTCVWPILAIGLLLVSGEHKVLNKVLDKIDLLPFKLAFPSNLNHLNWTFELKLCSKGLIHLFNFIILQKTYSGIKI